MLIENSNAKPMTKTTKPPRKSIRSPASKLAANKAKRQRQNGEHNDKDPPGSPTGFVRLFDDQSLELHNAVAHLSVGVALLLEYTAPILVVGWLWATTRRRPTNLTLGGVALAVA